MSLRRVQRGFTIIELMVVVAILAILSTIAIVYMSPNTKPVDVAQRFANLAEQAARLATQNGAVRADVAATDGTARTRITATAGNPTTFKVEVLVEDATPLWSEVASYQVPKAVWTDSFAPVVGTQSALTSVLVTDFSTLNLRFYPSGRSDSVTVFFYKSSGASADREARVSVLPLGTSTFVTNSWN